MLFRSDATVEDAARTTSVEAWNKFGGQVYYVMDGVLYPVTGDCDMCGVEYVNPCEGDNKAHPVDETCFESFDKSEVPYRCEDYGDMHPCMEQPNFLDHAWSQPECMGTLAGESCPIRCLPGYVPSQDRETWSHDLELQCIYGRFDRQPNCIGQPCDFTTAAPLNVGLQIFDDKDRKSVV